LGINRPSRMRVQKPSGGGKLEARPVCIQNADGLNVVVIMPAVSWPFGCLVPVSLGPDLTFVVKEEQGEPNSDLRKRAGEVSFEGNDRDGGCSTLDRAEIQELHYLFEVRGTVIVGRQYVFESGAVREPRVFVGYLFENGSDVCWGVVVCFPVPFEQYDDELPKQVELFMHRN